MTVNCTGEGATIDPSDAEFSQVRMTPKTWSALAKISSELEEDSIIAIGVILGLSIARSMARMEDLAGFWGMAPAPILATKVSLGPSTASATPSARLQGWRSVRATLMPN